MQAGSIALETDHDDGNPRFPSQAGYFTGNRLVVASIEVHISALPNTWIDARLFPPEKPNPHPLTRLGVW